MRVSKYTKAVQLHNGHFLLANLFWQTSLEITRREFEQWQQVLEGGHSPDDLEHTLLARLRQNKLLRDEDTDELGLMRKAYQASRFSPEVLGLTIAPTIDCNLACLYCYEDKRKSRMTEEVENKITTFVRSALPGKKRFKVIWYGGEPLMCKNTIYRLSQEFLEASNQYGCSYSAEMVTNGVLLDQETADRLSGFGHWTNVQVTLDGTAEYHDKKRPRRGGTGSYERIFSNVLHASKVLPLTLSMNIDRLNADSCHTLLDILSQHLDASSVRVRFSPIHPYGDGCRDIGEKNDVALMNNAEFSSIESDLLDHAREIGFKTLNPLTHKVASSCQAVTTHSFVVEPDGSLQRCWTEVGNRNTVIGHIGSTVVLNDDASLRWLRFDPTREEPCRSCDVLPTCFGGCPQRHIDHRPMEMTCRSIRFDIENRLVRQYQGKALVRRADGEPRHKTYPVYYMKSSSVRTKDES